MTTLATKPAKLTGPIPRKIDYNAAYKLRQQGVSLDDIAQLFGVTPLSVKNGLSRKGLLRRNLHQEQPVTEVIVRLPQNPLDSASREVRAIMAQQLKEQMAALKSQAVERKELAGRNGLAGALKTMADTAAIVFGWDKMSLPGVFSARIPEPIDVQAVVTDSPAIERKGTKDASEPTPATSTLDVTQPAPPAERSDESSSIASASHEQT
jgi:predicted transcriptional regulator